jgi:4-oxalocrotonate tautomerase
MPIVHVNVWEGFGQKNAKTVIRGITKVFVDLGIPEHAVEVVVHEIPKSHWGVAGEPASERLKDESPPK